MKQLHGTVALLTGASGGIGTAIAKRFAEDGIDLALCGRSAEKLEQTRQIAEAMGVRTMIGTGDLTEDGAAEAGGPPARRGRPGKTGQIGQAGRQDRQDQEGDFVQEGRRKAGQGRQAREAPGGFGRFQAGQGASRRGGPLAQPLREASLQVMI